MTTEADKVDAANVVNEADEAIKELTNQVNLLHSNLDLLFAQQRGPYGDRYSHLRHGSHPFAYHRQMNPFTRRLERKTWF